MSDKHLTLTIEIPSYYTADIDEYRDHESDFGNESEFILNIIGDGVSI